MKYVECQCQTRLWKYHRKTNTLKINYVAAAAKSIQLCPTLCNPRDAAHQAPPSLGFCKQEHWSGLPFPSPMHESEKWKWSRSVVSDLSDPMDCSPPGSSIHGIFQARVLEWGAIAFSGNCPYEPLISKRWVILPNKGIVRTYCKFMWLITE